MEELGEELQGMQKSIQDEYERLRQQEEGEEVTVLGRKFNSKREMQEYYKEDLRKRLPALKRLEGYPQGEDEEILTLSSPPYYTACPNPYINEFIDEWKRGRKEEEREEVLPSSFSIDVKEGKNNPIYNAHSYHTKVPHPAIMRYILHYTRPGDVVLDAFCGTGMTGVAAALCGDPSPEVKKKIEEERAEIGYPAVEWGERHAVLSDLSPVASFIAYNYNTPLNPVLFTREAEAILSEAEKELGWLYKTTDARGREATLNYMVWSDVFICNSCGADIVFYNEAVDKDKGEVKKEFCCPQCKARWKKKELKRKMERKEDFATKEYIKQAVTVPVLVSYIDKEGKKGRHLPTEADLELLKKIEEAPIDNWFPSDTMLDKPEGSKWGDTWRAGIHAGITHVHHFYTKRNLIVAAYLKSKMRGKRSEILISSYLEYRGSLMTRFIGKGMEGGKLSGTLYIPSLSVEVNLFEGIGRKVKDFERAFELLKNSSPNPVQVLSATSLNIRDSSIDYVFTDPPFGSNIMYSELNFITEAWLKVKTNNKEEAIENKTQNKTLSSYMQLMDSAFKEYYRVLKTGGAMTVVFSNTSDKIWNEIKKSITEAGFYIIDVKKLDKMQGSFKAVTTTVAVKQDLVINCVKYAKEKEEEEEESEEDKNLWDVVKAKITEAPLPSYSRVQDEYIVTDGEKRKVSTLVDEVTSYYTEHYEKTLPMNRERFLKEIERRYPVVDGMAFTNAQLQDFILDIQEHNIAGSLFGDVMVIDSEIAAVAYVTSRLRSGPLTYQDLQADYKAKYQGRRGEKAIELKTILAFYFGHEKDGTYRMLRPEEIKDKNALRRKELLRTWQVYCEDVDRGKEEVMKDIRREAVLEGFKVCTEAKDYKRIVKMGDLLDASILENDKEIRLFYDNARNKEIE